MIQKIIFLFALVALVCGSPQFEDPVIGADEVPEVDGMEGLQEMITEAAAEGRGTIVLQFGEKDARGGVLMPQARRFCANANIRVGNGYIRVSKCW